MGWPASEVEIGQIRRTTETFVVKTVAPTPAKSAKPTASKGEHPDFIAGQVDPILDKISEKGLHSLTDREREILEKARNRMGKR